MDDLREQDDLRRLRRDTGAALCLACGKCTTMCPLAALAGAESGDFAAGAEFAAHRAVAQDVENEVAGERFVLGACLTCSACEVRCPQAVHFSEYVRGLRRRLPPEARPPHPHDGALEHAAHLAVDGASIAGWARPHDWLGPGLAVRDEGEVALFVGCLPQFDALFGDSLGVRTTDIARAAVRLLNRLGIEPVVVAEERCCGHDLLWSGDQEEFAALARANAAAFAARGVQRVVTACAECYRTWSRDMPTVVGDYRPRVEHLSQLLAEAVRDGRLTFTGDGDGDGARVTYQDPCRLGRHMGEYEAPRAVLRAIDGDRFVDMEASGADALCCGTPGFIHCDATSRRIQNERLSHAARTGATHLVTACPKCLIHFACAQADGRRVGMGAEHGGPAVQVVDLQVVDLAVHALGALAGADG